MQLFFQLTASISIEDAEKFVKEAESLEKLFCLTNPLTLLYLTITEEMSKPITDPYSNENMIPMLINKVVSGMNPFLSVPCLVMR